MRVTDFEKRNLQNSSLIHFLLGCAMFFLPEPGFERFFAYPSLELGQTLALVAVVLKILGFGAVGIALSDLAESKGHSRWWGLMFTLPLLGWIVVVALTDRNRPWCGPIIIRRYRFR